MNPLVTTKVRHGSEKTIASRQALVKITILRNSKGSATGINVTHDKTNDGKPHIVWEGSKDRVKLEKLPFEVMWKAVHLVEGDTVSIVPKEPGSPAFFEWASCLMDFEYPEINCERVRRGPTDHVRESWKYKVVFNEGKDDELLLDPVIIIEE